MYPIKQYIDRPTLLGLSCLSKLNFLFPDKCYLKLYYKLRMGRKLNLRNPKLFSEKLQWLKLYDRKPIYTKLVDKYEVKKIVKTLIGEQYVIPTIGVWENFKDIEWDRLPTQFVLKTTHSGGSTGVVICKNKALLDIEKTKKILEKSLKSDIYKTLREWPYKNVKKQIIAEPLLVDKTCPYLRDYKFYCFNGEPKLFYITSNKGLNLPINQDFFDLKGNHLEIQDEKYLNNPTQSPNLPNRLCDMIEICKKISKDIPEVRVDLYEIEDQIYFGEYTFYEGSGFCKFIPEKYNSILGDLIHLPI